MSGLSVTAVTPATASSGGVAPVAPAESVAERPSPLDLVAAIADPASLSIETRSAPGVVCARIDVAGRPVRVYAQDPRVSGGALGAREADAIVATLEQAAREGSAVLGIIASSGARIQEGVAALDGYGRVFAAQVALRGRVPQVAVVIGPAAGGGAYSPALGDFIVQAEAGRMFLTGPGVVRDAVGEDVDADTLGGHAVHRRNGVADLNVGGDAGLVETVRQLLGFLPNQRSGLPITATRAPAVELGAAPVPALSRRVYDVRDVIRGVCDGDSWLELAPGWARNVCAGIARIDGMPVMFIANQPRWLGGVLDVPGSLKAAGYVRRADRLGLPLVVLVDTPGFMPGLAQEQAGIIRAGAELVDAFAASRVPRITVVLRKAFGGAYIAMNARGLGATRSYAWTTSQVGIMAARPAVSIIERRRIAAAEDPIAERDRLADEYAASQLTPATALAAGGVDEVIAPPRTRQALADTLGRALGAPPR